MWRTATDRASVIALPLTVNRPLIVMRLPSPLTDWSAEEISG